MSDVVLFNQAQGADALLVSDGPPGPVGPPGTLVASGLTFRTPQQHSGLANDSASDSTPFSDLITAVKSTAITGYQYGNAGGRAYLPQGGPAYRLSSTIDVDVAVRMEGDGGGFPPGIWATILHPDPGLTAIRNQSYNTTGATGTDAGDAFTGSGSTYIGIGILGHYDGTTNLEAEAHGYHLRGTAAIRDGGAYGMQGDGVNIHAGVGLPELGGANCWYIDRFWSEGNRNGLWTSGSDTNAGVAIQFMVSGAREWGIKDESGAANTYIGPLAQLCGVDGIGTAARPSACCHYAGQHYAVRVGQEAWCAANPPTGSTSSNTGWIRFEAGGEVIPGFKTWFNGMVCRAGGPWRIAFGGTIIGGYYEGSEPPVQNGGGGLMIGGSWGGLGRPIGGAYINAGANTVLLNALIVEQGGVQIYDDVGGSLQIGRVNPGNPAVIAPTSAAPSLTLNSPNNSPKITISNSEVDVYSCYFLSTNLNPFTDNAVALGGSGHRFTELWAASATIQTSDRNHKTQVRKLSGKPFAALLDAVAAVPLVAFKFKDAVKAKGKSARDHYGIVAQDLHDEMVKRGLEPFVGGVLGRDQVMEDVEEEYEIEREAMRTEFQHEDQIEVVDGKAILRSVLVEKAVPDFDEVPVHDEDGNPVIIPARPPQKRMMLVDGVPTEQEFPGSPERPMMHKVRRMERVTEKRIVRKPKLKDGEPELIWNVRYDEFWALRQASLERQARPGSA